MVSAMNLCYVSSEFRNPAPLDMEWWESSPAQLDDVLKRISRLGLKQVELSAPHIKMNMSSREITRVKMSLNSTDVRIACVDSDAFLWTITNTDLKQAFKFIELAHKLEATIVRVFSGPENRGSRRRAIDFLRKTAERAGNYGITVGVENIWYHHFGKIDLMKHGLQEIDADGLAALVDVANFYVGGEDPVDAANKLASRMIHGHVKDAARFEDDTEWKVLGKGDLSARGMYPRIIQELKGQGYNGCLSIEPHVPPSRDTLEESVRFLQPLL